MNKNQRENTAKYLYDISKGIALLAVVGNIVKDQWVISNLIIGLIAAIGFFIMTNLTILFIVLAIIGFTGAILTYLKQRKSRRQHKSKL